MLSLEQCRALTQDMDISDEKLLLLRGALYQLAEGIIARNDREKCHTIQTCKQTRLYIAESPVTDRCTRGVA